MNKKPDGGSDHYKQHEIEPIQVIEDWELDFRLANVIKYVARFEHQASTDIMSSHARDLNKAIWYLNRYIQIELGEEYMEYEYVGVYKFQHKEVDDYAHWRKCEHGSAKDLCEYCSGINDPNPKRKTS